MDAGRIGQLYSSVDDRVDNPLLDNNDSAIGSVRKGWSGGGQQAMSNDEIEQIRYKQILADHAWGFCQSMGVRNLDITTDTGSKVTLTELLVEYREETLRTLASGMKKVLTTEQLADLKYSCDPLGSFLEDLEP